MRNASNRRRRYSPTPIQVTGSADAPDRLRVRGVFRTGDNTSITRAPVALHGSAVRGPPDGPELVSKWENG